MKSNVSKLFAFFALALLAVLVGCNTGLNPNGQAAKVAAPVFSSLGGNYPADFAVGISCSTNGAAIHYTTNGDIPTSLSPVYGSPVQVSGNGTSRTIRAMATKTGMTDSDVTSADYAIAYPPTDSPVFSPDGGTYPSNQSVNITCATNGATIYFTENGNDPTGSSLVFNGPAISVSGNTTVLTIKAFARKAGMSDSPIVSATYAIQYPFVETPVFSPTGGIYSVNQSVRISSATSGATIHYTTNGNPPNSGSTVYNGTPIPVSGIGTSMTIIAYATKAGMSNSAMASASFTIDTSNLVFERPSAGSGAVYLSSWADPNGSDYDEYVWDDFTPAADANITEVLWHGAYMHNKLYTDTVWHFTIAFFESIAGGSQPHVNNPQLPEIFLAYYDINGNANETLVGTVGASTMYAYRHTLPTPFAVTAGTKYWIRIQASQIGVPDWGIAAGSGGDGAHFMFDTGAARFFAPWGDVAFSLK